MVITEITEYTPQALQQMQVLIGQLTDEYQLTEEALRDVIADKNSLLFVAIMTEGSIEQTEGSMERTEGSTEQTEGGEGRIVGCEELAEGSEGRIVGCATLCVFCSPTGRKATIEDVVVSRECRGMHLGEQLVGHLIDTARRQAPIELHLTSKPIRVAANRLYQKMGFTRKETNCYVMKVQETTNPTNRH